MQNIEIKVRTDNSEELLWNALESGAQFREIFDDTDTYFRVPNGRLKLRVSDSKKTGTLIHYERADEGLSRVSDYRLIPVPDADAMRETLSRALGVLVTVRKSRMLLVYGSTRIHFDEVEGLGSFVELETVVSSQSIVEALDEHGLVFEWLKLDSYEIVPVSYSDLLLNAP